MSQAYTEPSMNGPRWEYAQFLYQNPTTVYFTHRPELAWSNISAWDALHFLGEHGFELVSVTRTVDYYKAEATGLMNGVSLAGTEQSSLYVLKRLVGADEPLELPFLHPETRMEHQERAAKEAQIAEEIQRLGLSPGQAARLRLGYKTY